MRLVLSLLLSLWTVGQCWGAWGSTPTPPGRGGGGGYNPGEEFPALGGGRPGSQDDGRGAGGYNPGGEERPGHQGLQPQELSHRTGSALQSYCQNTCRNKLHFHGNRDLWKKPFIYEARESSLVPYNSFSAETVHF